MLNTDLIEKIINAIDDINRCLDNSEQLDSSRQIQHEFGILVNKYCAFIKREGIEKEILCDQTVFKKLGEGKYIRDKNYKFKGLIWDNIDYWVESVEIIKEATRYDAKFYLTEEVLYLISNKLTFHDCINQSEELLIGEGDFSFAYSYIVTHQNRKLIASEYELSNPYKKFLNIDFNKAVIYLLNKGVIIAYGMDAIKLHEDEHLIGNVGINRFKHIQFNCPYDTRDRDGTIECSIKKPHTKQLIDGFMASAKQLLHSDGRLHVSIQQPKHVIFGKWGKEEYQKAWDLPKAALTHQFKLVRVMGDIKDRYVNKIRSILNEEEPKALYTTFLGHGQTHRVNQFIFKHRLDYLDYITDSGSDSESENEPSKSKPKRKKMMLPSKH